ncbi:YdaS family helix-turn-helix protein [Pseudomonas haemolytica]|uniref:Helix-turn-helix domain-containing protein n=1 Tax=Pseudomonas haemolytica TaxID=2600065 RepID=A0A5P1DDA4_9PSED|nr:helix-turn-helix domain-containing protein [Pseudomonas haemolytica]
MSIDAMTSAAKAAGSQTALAKALGCTPQNVQWMCSTGSVPAKHVLKIEAVTGISRHQLRPDLYPDASPTLDANVRQTSPPGQTADGAVNPSSTQQAHL